MRIPVRLPDFEDWKTQVKCQAGCPVATDAGRYVQLIAEGRDEDAFLVARAPNPFAVTWQLATWNRELTTDHRILWQLTGKFDMNFGRKYQAEG